MPTTILKHMIYQQPFSLEGNGSVAIDHKFQQQKEGTASRSAISRVKDNDNCVEYIHHITKKKHRIKYSARRDTDSDTRTDQRPKLLSRHNNQNNSPANKRDTKQDYDRRAPINKRKPNTKPQKN